MSTGFKSERDTLLELAAMNARERFLNLEDGVMGWEDLFKAGAEWEKGQNEGNKKELEIFEYCLPHLDQMWAATILGIILGCDFRDVKTALDRMHL